MSLPYVQTNTWPVGNVVICRFCFGNRNLTPAEIAAFVAGNGLPAGVGVDQPVVECELELPTGSGWTEQILTGASVVHDALGEYHVLVTAANPGTYSYRGFSVDGGGNPLASSRKMSFTAA